MSHLFKIPKPRKSRKSPKDPNVNSLRLVEVHSNIDPQKVEVLLASGDEQGVVKYRLETGMTNPNSKDSSPAVSETDFLIPVHSSNNDVIGDALAYSKVLVGYLKAHKIPGRIREEKEKWFNDQLNQAFRH